MTARIPLKPNGSNLQEMTSAEIGAITDLAVWLYGGNPSVNVSQVASSGNISPTMADTRTAAGAESTSTTADPPESTTAEPTTVTINYDRISSSTENTAGASDTNSVGFPCYYDGGNIYAMNSTDFYDTFCKPAIDKLIDGTDRPGTYRIHTSTTLTNHTLISTTPVFIDTRADTAAYTSGGIPETLDQPTTVLSYYLFRTDQAIMTEPSIVEPMKVRSDGSVQPFTVANFKTVLETMIRNQASENENSHRLRYRINGSGNARGTTMTDTKLDGSGAHTTRFVGVDDYRAQEFPDGTAQNISTWNLNIYKV